MCTWGLGREAPSWGVTSFLLPGKPRAMVSLSFCSASSWRWGDFGRTWFLSDQRFFLSQAGLIILVLLLILGGASILFSRVTTPPCIPIRMDAEDMTQGEIHPSWKGKHCMSAPERGIYSRHLHSISE